MALVVGIDIGTSGVRAMAVDATGRVRGEAKVALPPPRTEGARIFQDPVLWREALFAALGGLGGQVTLEDVAALAVDGTSGTVVAVDAAGEPLGPGLLYNDAAAVEAAG